MAKSKKRILLILPPLIIGIIALAWSYQGREEPKQMPLAETETLVRVILAPQVDVLPRALGYGYAQPGKVWEAVAQVSGKIVQIHPQLKKGAILGKGEVLLRIDPTDYELAISEIDSDIRSVNAQIAELTAKEQNTKASLKIERRSMELSQRDLERKRQLLAKKAVSQAAVDQEERTVLAGRQSVQSLKNTLNLLPTEKAVLGAQQARNRAQLAAARLDLERTTITAPFDSRIAEVAVEKTQFAAQGKVLVVADSLDVAEVTAQLPIGKLINLMPQGAAIPAHARGLMESLPDLLRLSAVVRLRGGDLNARWDARFTRISDMVDPQTRTVGIIVAVDDPYRKAILGVRPPLAKNMFVEVELRGPVKPDQVVVPRSALHDGQVYIVNGDSRLERRKVGVAFLQTNFAVIGGGLAAGERIVVSDPVPAIEGMLLKPVVDQALAESLAADARGEGPVR